MVGCWKTPHRCCNSVRNRDPCCHNNQKESVSGRKDTGEDRGGREREREGEDAERTGVPGLCRGGFAKKNIDHTNRKKREMKRKGRERMLHHLRVHERIPPTAAAGWTCAGDGGLPADDNGGEDGGDGEDGGLEEDELDEEEDDDDAEGKELELI
jgi:hypothetical protein